MNRGKFEKTDEKYFNYIDKLENMNPPVKELIYNFPVFVGEVNIARTLFFYELYKKVLNLSGHIAEVGTYKGASFVLWAKLIKLFEPYNNTQVHGFDWFEGMKTGGNDDKSNEGLYKADYKTLKQLIDLQNLDDVGLLHKMDVTKELKPYIESNPYMRFKLVFIDCGLEEVLEKSLEVFWPRLVTGGILIMDHHNMESSPTESDIIEKYIGKNLVRQMTFNRHSSGYIIKD